MLLVTWNEDLANDVRILDRQHKLLTDLLNELHEARAAGHDSHDLDRILAKLIHGNSLHFATEERLMTAIAYPDYAHHKAEHDRLLQEVRAIQADLNAGKAPITAEQVLYLRRWLTEHIQEADKRLGFFMRRKGVK